MGAALTIIEPSEIRQKKNSARDELLKVLDQDRTDAVVEHRQRIRKPMTAHAAKLLAGKFARCPDPNAAADAMIANGWTGFEPHWLERHAPVGRAAPSSKPESLRDYALRQLFEDEGDHGNDRP